MATQPALLRKGEHDVRLCGALRLLGEAKLVVDLEKRQAVENASCGVVWTALVVAMLAVGGFSVEKVLAIREALERRGLLNPRKLAEWDDARITRELTAAGYTRGMLTGMYAERLSAAMKELAAAERLPQAEELLASGSASRIADLLLPKKGVGPRVIENFLALRQSLSRQARHQI